MPVNLSSSSIPPTLSGMASVGQSGIPRFWATIWSDVLKTSIEPSTRRKHLTALDRLYAAVELQHGRDCLDRLIADGDGDALEDCLVGFLAHLRNESAVDNADKTSTWMSAISFVKDMLRYAGSASDARASKMEEKLLRLDTLYRQLVPNRENPAPPVRALSPLVVEDLYEIFNPDSPRNPFKTEALRWRNLLLFMLMLRLGLRRGEAALLHTSSFKEDFDSVAGKTVHWLDVEETNDDDPRYEQPGLKTGSSRRQLPLPREIIEAEQRYSRSYRGRVNYTHLLISQKAKPLSLRSFNEIFETATRSLSGEARKSLLKQGLQGVSCHDLRHTSAVVRMKRYQDSGLDVDKAQEKLRVFFGWSRTSNMPRLYAKAYFETTLAEVWDEKFDTFVDALRDINPEHGN
ncbi:MULTISPECIES: tyrosine-type recombinase/integrase [unclassified Agrobacterium]|uniref:tyrosine-type recombinase/integrase n=1 Tax=unclassified Agrobacterium TaxID=2632611 RepID=UPI002448D4AB|nr:MULTISPECIES: tyrosine-type recombinase/integrase [unclassified Agrobacterium]MDH0614131.1 tyrosine-type recombinase/integrase [Agrobacterium sp. GD03872]MDH0695574.1 tyrosine-type recombinase/integrase [Agrobacterium sp. GD03871]MDH1058476.1 tyrosine-type recombinase/integrase [Agrobacterium sp. GD03992]MDH2209582.1 tyrosine-type recombinase/integrase [Agrobacterium sp. GD03643]MDH2218986.1 tyrosine-type recombinase/integrase [Agrobacterium sp. GD03638]